MKEKIITLWCLLIVTLPLKAEYDVFGLETKYGDFILYGDSIASSAKKIMEKHNVTTNEFEDILISFINNPTNSIKAYQCSSSDILGVITEVSQSEKVIDYIDSIIKSEKIDLYWKAINEYKKIFPYSIETLSKMESYIQINDKTSCKRRCEIFIDISKAIETDDSLSADIRIQIIKIMLKYLTYDLSNWVYLDKTLCEKIPSYRHSIQRKNMIEYIQSKEANLTEWYKGELSKILEDFNLAIKEKPLIDISDEIIREEIKTYKCTKYEEWEI